MAFFGLFGKKDSESREALDKGLEKTGHMWNADVGRDFHDILTAKLSGKPCNLLILNIQVFLSAAVSFQTQSQITNNKHQGHHYHAVAGPLC